jgi:hypothetical protein
MVRKRVLDLKYVLIWLGCDLILIIFAIFPQLMNGLADLLGIYSPMNMIFFLGFVFIIMILFSLTVALSKVTGRVRRIAQILAMLPEDIRKQISDELKRNGEM